MISVIFSKTIYQYILDIEYMIREKINLPNLRYIEYV